MRKISPRTETIFKPCQDATLNHVQVYEHFIYFIQRSNVRNCSFLFQFGRTFVAVKNSNSDVKPGLDFPRNNKHITPHLSPYNIVLSVLNWQGSLVHYMNVKLCSNVV
jgi:hypothetical protein